MPKKEGSSMKCSESEPKPYGKFLGGYVAGTLRYHGKNHQKVVMTGCPEELFSQKVSAKQILEMMDRSETAEYDSGEALHA